MFAIIGKDWQINRQISPPNSKQPLLLGNYWLTDVFVLWELLELAKGWTLACNFEKSNSLNDSLLCKAWILIFKTSKFYIIFFYLLVVIENIALEVHFIFHLGGSHLSSFIIPRLLAYSHHPNCSPVCAWQQWVFVFFSFFSFSCELCSYWAPVILLAIRVCVCVCLCTWISYVYLHVQNFQVTLRVWYHQTE